MRQLSLLDDNFSPLAGVMPAIKAAMRRAAGDPDGEGRKMLAEKLTQIGKREEVALTGGNAKGISIDVLNKMLSPSDLSHPPSVNALVAFCRATGDIEPVRIILQAVSHELDIMTEADRRYRDIGKADVDMKAARKRKRRLEDAL